MPSKKHLNSWIITHNKDCSENIILFLTDGSPDDEVSQFQALLINETTSKNPIVLFTYGIGDDLDENTTILLKKLACDYGGINFNINDAEGRSDLVEKMRQYFVFLSAGIKIQDPVWTQPYLDAWIEQMIISAALPIYFEKEDNPQFSILLGVAVVDIKMSYLQQFGISEQNSEGKFNDGFPCYFNNLTQCQKQVIRRFQSQQKVCDSSLNCTGSIDPRCDNNSTYQGLNWKTEDTSDDFCCGLTVGQFVGILVGSILGFLLIVGIIVFCVWRRKKIKARQPNPDGPSPDQQPQSAKRFKD